jgi:hypothetical protein
VSAPATVTLDEVAERYLRCSVEAARCRAKRGRLPVLPLQRRPEYLFNREAWDLWAEGKPVPTRHAAGR